MASSGITTGHKVASSSRWTTSKPSASVTDDGLGAAGSWSRDLSQVNTAESVPGNDGLKAGAATRGGSPRRMESEAEPRRRSSDQTAAF